MTDDDYYGDRPLRQPGQRLTLPDQRPPGQTMPGSIEIGPPQDVAGVWRSLAACRGLPTEWWYVQGRITPEGLAMLKRAQAVCAECPVAMDCLTDAVMRNEQHGTWGGLTPKPLGRLRSATNRPGGWRIAAPEVLMPPPAKNDPHPDVMPGPTGTAA